MPDSRSLTFGFCDPRKRPSDLGIFFFSLDHQNPSDISERVLEAEEGSFWSRHNLVNFAALHCLLSPSPMSPHSQSGPGIQIPRNKEVTEVQISVMNKERRVTGLRHFSSTSTAAQGPGMDAQGMHLLKSLSSESPMEKVSVRRNRLANYKLLPCVLSCFSHAQFFMTPRTVAHQAPWSMEFSRQEYWSGLPFPPPGDLPDPGMKPRSPAL